MKFYDREREIAILRDMAEKAKESAKFTVVTGRRRIGKTTMIMKAYSKETMLYFFVARKAEKDLCVSYAEEISNKLGIPLIGAPSTFAEVFEYVMKVSQQRSFTLVIDEFQEFLKVNSSIYSDMQRIWDLYKDTSKINLVVSGSIYRLMNKIFKDRSEPLYGRQDRQIMVRPFAPSVLKEIMADYNPDYDADDLLALYSYTGGVAKYVQLLMEAGATSKDEIIGALSESDSFFIEEGKYLLVDEFGTDYGVYFSILAAIASGNTSRREIESMIGKEAGGYLTRLEKDYELIEKVQPIYEAAPNKNVKYRIIDNFLNFWFRFVFKYNYMLEIQANEQFKKILQRDYEVFSGLMLERYFKAKMQETQEYTRIGSWWDRKGQNEIDIVADNEFDKTVSFIEVKRNPKKYNAEALTAKIDNFVAVTKHYSDYKITHSCLSLPDM